MNRVTTSLWMGWLSLSRDKVALMMTFALPVAFFSIFVGIFGQMVGSGGSGTTRVHVIVVDEDKSDASRRFVQALQEEDSLKIQSAPDKTPDQPYDRATASDLVKTGDMSAAIVLPKGFGATFGSFEGDSVAVDLIQDKQRDPVAPQMVAGLMQKAAMTGAPDLMIERGIDQFDKYAGGLTPQQRTAMDTWLPKLRDELDQSKKDNAAATQPDASSSKEKADLGGFQGMVRVNAVDVHKDEHKTEWAAFIAFQVSQTAVMFLLFSMSGAAGGLLDEQDSGTLERVLTSNVGMNGLLLSKWLFIALMGALQLTVMFLWAWKPFGLELWQPLHLGGFAIMTAFTAMAGAAFGMVLATACKTRGQLGGVSTIVILIMSAVGGSMFPRFLMSDTMKKIGLFTFNGWALDGYRKVFYDNLPLWQLWPQVAVLAGLTVVFLIISRLFARRWEVA